MIHQFSDFEFDSENKTLYFKNKELKLSKQHQQLLAFFVQQDGRKVTKDELIDNVWNGRVVTSNTIDQSVSKLKKTLSALKDDQYFETIYGQGIKFLPKVSVKNLPKTPKYTKKIAPKILLFMLAVFLIWLYNSQPFTKQKIKFSTTNSNNILVLPTNFQQLEVSDIKQQGLNELLRLTFNNTDSEGQIIFTNISDSSQETLEKFWLIDKELTVLQSNVIKNGEIYEAAINISQGSKTLVEKTLSADNLNQLLINQIEYISQYKNNAVVMKKKNLTVDEMFVKALGYKKTGNNLKAKELLLQILKQQDNYYQARLELAKIFILEKEYDKSMAQLRTLKSTKAYTIVGTEIELAIAKINFVQDNFEPIVKQLTEYQLGHMDIGEVKKSKIKLQLGKAYRALGNMQNAMKFFKQATSNLNQNFNPNLFAQSYYGQGMVLLNQSNDNNVLAYFEQALEFAKQAKNLQLQIIILDEMAKMLWVSNQPEKGIELKKQALAIMELVHDKSEVAKGLGTLAGFLIQRGRFSEAKKVNDRLKKIAKDLERDTLMLHYLHYDAVILMNFFKFDEAKTQIDKQLELAIKSNNHVMQLDNAFIEFELRLAKKDTHNFNQEWDKRNKLIKKFGFERFQVYMDLYLARYKQQIGNTKEAIELLEKISEKSKSNKDMKILVDAQNILAEIYLTIDAQQSLDILNGIEQYQPNDNPYLEIKARALNEIGKKIEALSLLNQAKLVFHEAWKIENQALLEQIQEELN